MVLSQFGIPAQRLGEKQLLKSEIRHLLRVLGIKNENHVTILVESSQFLYQSRFAKNSIDIYRGAFRMSVASRLSSP